MSVKFSAALFQQLGVSHWTPRDSALHSLSEMTSAPELSASMDQDHATDVVRDESYSEPVAASVSDAVGSEAVSETSTLEGVVSSRQVVLLGQGLQSLWQDESKAEWQLWSQIMHAMSWSEEEVLFVDSSLLVSEEQLYSSVEEIIDSGVDCLLSMDPEHVINEVLSEGSEVLPVPDFDLMLSDPHAKKSFYQQALRLDAQLR
ncbi:hypothetical protein [Thiomicrorhabdus xiamenensis]|uniref:Uncharacterized protein n=1 Tax=Thiomicrorhabdus xiamenensis TaxID=2739063 RepID=A0A7D4SIK1_9GAMM|nr:hypothetical protein [Thiomicrorhabdus xiamenensis]QKI88759.1 hypothetical protein HQN79_03845 [Thiomicrorhabdus xiamenensis]